MLESFYTRLTAYFGPPYSSPEQAKMEGGGEDCIGNALRTLNDFMSDHATYVSVAAAHGVFPYGTRLCIPAINDAMGRNIDFRVVDTGSPKYFTGRSHLDICVSGESASFSELLNRDHVLVIASMP